MHGHQVVDGGGAGQVDGEGMGDAASLSNSLLHGGGSRGVVCVVEHHCCSVGGEPFDDRPADPARAACNDRGLAVKCAHLVLPAGNDAANRETPMPSE
jgi:hypothetical protein